jgi:hypothetical protein
VRVTQLGQPARPLELTTGGVTTAPLGPGGAGTGPQPQGGALVIVEVLWQQPLHPVTAMTATRTTPMTNVRRFMDSFLLWYDPPRWTAGMRALPTHSLPSGRAASSPEARERLLQQRVRHRVGTLLHGRVASAAEQCRAADRDRLSSFSGRSAPIRQIPLVAAIPRDAASRPSGWNVPPRSCVALDNRPVATYP